MALLRKILIPFFVTIVSTSFGQNLVPISSSCESIYLDKMQVLYIGLPNPITIETSYSSVKKISISNGKISGGNGKFIVIPNKLGRLQITIEHDGGKKIIYDYRVKEIPRPEIYNLASNFKATDSLKNMVIEVGSRDFDYYIDYYIDSFIVTKISNNTLSKSLNVGSKFSPKTAELFSNLQPGDLMIFDNIKCTYFEKIKTTAYGFVMRIE